MPKVHSTPSTKPSKPTGDFPLFAHATKRWAKKINGKTLYFGPWDDPAGALKRYQKFVKTGCQELVSGVSEQVSNSERPEGSPLFLHASGRWAKKIHGKFVYFGRGSHADALAEYERKKDDLHAGRKPRDEKDEEGLTVYLLCAKFIQFKKRRRDTGELSLHTFRDYTTVCKLLVKSLHKERLVSDLGPDDFAGLRTMMAKKWGKVRLGTFITMIRCVFNFAVKDGLIVRVPVYGEGFARPSKKALRKERQAQGSKMFEAAELRAMLDKATPSLKAMLLLGVNCAFGNSDVGNLPLKALDLDKGFIEYPRAKTAIERRIPLWPETVAALRDWLKVRPKAVKQEHAGLVFITAKGDTWAKETSDNPVSKETAKLMKECGVTGHRNFYCCRHTFQTQGDESRDAITVRKIMGHTFDDDIGNVYRERVSDARLLAVTEHVRQWLFADNQAGGDEQGEQGEAAEPKQAAAQADASKPRLRLYAG